MKSEWNDSEIALLKEIYYKLISDGDYVSAKAIATTLFEVSTDGGEQ